MAKFGIQVIAMRVSQLSLPVPVMPTSSKSWGAASLWVLPTLPVVVALELSLVHLPMWFSLV